MKTAIPSEPPQVGLTLLRRRFPKVAALVKRHGAVIITEQGVPTLIMTKARKG